MFIKVMIGISLIVTVILILAAMKPSQATISREMVIAASPEALFPYINNAKKSYEWMPWADGDPGIKISFSGPEEGVGSSSSWEGEKMGVGTSEVIESIPNKAVRTRLVYTKPHEMNQIAEITLTPTDDGTLVKWSVNGHNSFFFRIMCVFINIDKIVGDQFTQGLTKLKVLAEKK